VTARAGRASQLAAARPHRPIAARGQPTSRPLPPDLGAAAAVATIAAVRHLASVLFALLLAAALAIGAYAASWTLRRPPHAELTPAATPAATPLPAAARLADSADFARVMPPAPDRGDPTLVDLTIEIVGLPPAWQPPDAGLAVASRRGGRIAWLPLVRPQGTDATLRVCQPCPVGDEVVVALAPARTNALRSYLARATTTVTAAATLQLDARASELALRRTDDAAGSGPFRLYRDGDDAWLPAEAPAGIDLANPLRLWLGAGGYRLVDVLAPADGMAIRVPETREFVVTGPQPPARDDRR
jgi:hypothetical protein